MLLAAVIVTFSAHSRQSNINIDDITQRAGVKHVSSVDYHEKNDTRLVSNVTEHSHLHYQNQKDPGQMVLHRGDIVARHHSSPTHNHPYLPRAFENH